MDPETFNATIARIGVAQARLARLLGYVPTTVYRWSTGELAVPRIVQLVLTLLDSTNLTVEDLEQLLAADKPG